MSIGEKLTTIAENEQKVFDAGKKAEYDKQWDNQQNYGKRQNYLCGFAGAGWTNENFKPKYSMDITYAYMMFRNNACTRSLPDICTEQNISIKFDKTTEFTQTFFAAGFSVIGEVSTISATTLPSTFYGIKAHTIEKLVLKDNGTQTYSSTFTNANTLTHIIIEGKIGTAFDIHYSPLDKESILSIADAVLDKTFTIKFNLDAVNKAFETSEGTNDGSTSTEWTNLWTDKPKVTISLLNA